MQSVSFNMSSMLNLLSYEYDMAQLRNEKNKPISTQVNVISKEKGSVFLVNNIGNVQGLTILVINSVTTAFPRTIIERKPTIIEQLNICIDIQESLA